jgi:hypothetical protein
MSVNLTLEINGEKHFAVGSTNKDSVVFWSVTNVSKKIYLGNEVNIAAYYSAIIGK